MVTMKVKIETDIRTWPSFSEAVTRLATTGPASVLCRNDTVSVLKHLEALRNLHKYLMRGLCYAITPIVLVRKNLEEIHDPIRTRAPRSHASLFVNRSRRQKVVQRNTQSASLGALLNIKFLGSSAQRKRIPPGWGFPQRLHPQRSYLVLA